MDAACCSSTLLPYIVYRAAQRGQLWAEKHWEQAVLEVFTGVLGRVKAHRLPCFPIIP